jgi:hypothetical protein
MPLVMLLNPPLLVRSLRTAGLPVRLPQARPGRRPAVQQLMLFNRFCFTCNPVPPKGLLFSFSNERKTSPKACRSLLSPSLTRFTLMYPFHYLLGIYLRNDHAIWRFAA